MNSSIVQQKMSQGAEAWRSFFFFLFMCKDMRMKSGVKFSASDNGRLLALQRVGYYTAGTNTVEPDYNDIGLCDISSITSDFLWYQLIPYC
jgi:hypothetical protein